ncbi:MAG: tetratricopeptide repeat protein [Chitinophagaceae bacterium]|nr:tetratricopeptide repeat protein [Chitinophagaceae bacterium]
MEYLEFIDLVAKTFEENKVTVFFGAGISRNSGVPLVDEIKKEILTHLCKEKVEITNLLNDKIPFELFMQTLIEYSDSEKLLELFELGEPNANHYFLAKLAKKGKLNCVVTTNFDTLLEKAFDIEGITYKVFHTEESFENIENKKDSVSIIKIHGSIENRLQMAVTLKRVAGKRLFSARKKVIADVMQNNSGGHLLVLGYSCSDYFDINPIIEDVKDRNKILFVQHSRLGDQTLAISPISEMSGNNPFKKYDGNFLNVNTDYFVKDFSFHFLKETIRYDTIKKPEWKKIIDDWISDICLKKGKLVMGYIAGQIFNVCARYGAAINYFNNTLAQAIAIDNNEYKINALYSLGRCYRDTQANNKGFQKALRYLYMAYNNSRKHKVLKKQCFCMLSMGVTYEDKKQHYVAIKFYESALKIANYLNEKDISAICLGNLGIVMKNLGEEMVATSNYLFQKAIRYHERAIKLSIETGDKASEGRTYGNIGIVYSCMGITDKIIEYYDKAFKIAEDLSDFRHMGIWAFNKGYDLRKVDIIYAKAEIEKAKKIFQTIEPPLENYIAICDKEISDIDKVT